MLERIRQARQDHSILKRKRVAKGAEVITQTILKDINRKEVKEKAEQKILKKKTQKPKASLKVNSTSSHSNGDLSVHTESFDSINFSECLIDTKYGQEVEVSTMEILDEQTGHIRTMVVTNAVIEKPKAPNVGRKRRFSRRETVTNTKKIKQPKRPNIKKTCENSSTTSEEDIMSIHSDSDIDNIVSPSDDEIEDEAAIKQKMNEKEDAIFAKIEALDTIDKTEHQLQTEIEPNILENKINFKENEINEKEVIVKEKKVCNKGKSINNKQKNATNVNENKENEGESSMLKTGAEEVTTVAYDIGQTVLVRYYGKKTWKYYVGWITEIKNSQFNRKYEISFYRTVRAKNNLKFVKPKKCDVDLVPIDVIVKEIQLIQIRENPDEYVLNNDEEEVYF